MPQNLDKTKEETETIWDKTQREIREANARRKGTYVDNWKSLLPEGSQWFPGSTGKPDCKICKGIGWVRHDVPLRDPEFGKLHPCECSL